MDLPAVFNLSNSVTGAPLSERPSFNNRAESLYVTSFNNKKSIFKCMFGVCKDYQMVILLSEKEGWTE